MRLVSLSVLFLCGLSIAGCGSDSSPQTLESSAIESYVSENPEAVALQEELDAAAEAEAEAEDE